MKRIKQDLTEGAEGKSLLPPLPPVRLLFIFYFTFCLSLTASAQIQQAWVARYNNGITNGNHQAIKMSLDSGGNLYVLGSSQNSNAQTGYVTLKYAPNGNQLWAARYDSTNNPSAIPSGIVLDSSNNAVVTGTALTIKYNSAGNQMWTAPYNGTSLAVDSSGNVIVTGFASGFKTVKLNSTGTNLWTAVYTEPKGRAQSQVALVDNYSNIYIAGADTYACFPGACYQQLLIVKYDRYGNQLWAAGNNQDGNPVRAVQIGGAAVDPAGNFYTVVDFEPGIAVYTALKYDSNGSIVWTEYPANRNLFNMANGVALSILGHFLVTGAIYHGGNNSPFGASYGTLQLSPNGGLEWTNLYPSISSATSVGTSIAVDSSNNSYVTGYSPGANGSNDIVTIAYDTNGKQLWLQRYDGPAHGDDAGNAIAVDNNGNVYVAGYETVPGGGTEMVLIKYSPVTIQRQTNGNILLQTQGSPGEAFDIRASTNLDTWSDVATNTADTNGLLQFLDTNAGLYPARFYLTIPQ
jgi:hypothetical protein